jgi:hypothetical protein
MGRLNFRLDDELETLIDMAVDLSEMADRSKWTREALWAQATREIAEHQRQQVLAEALKPQPDRRLGVVSQRRLGFTTARQMCSHPAQALWTGFREDTCLVCGQSFPKQRMVSS